MTTFTSLPQDLVFAQIRALSTQQICHLTPAPGPYREPAALAAFITATANGQGHALAHADAFLRGLAASLDDPAVMACRDGLYALAARSWLSPEDYTILTGGLQAVGVCVHHDDLPPNTTTLIPHVIPAALTARTLATQALTTFTPREAQIADDAIFRHQVLTGWRYLVDARRFVLHREHHQPVYLVDRGDCAEPGCRLILRQGALAG